MEGSFSVPRSEIENRIRIIQELMQNEAIPSILVVHRPDLFYFTGTAQRAFLFLYEDKDPLLLVKSSLKRAKNESPLRHIKKIDSVKELPNLTKGYTGSDIKILGLELDVMPYNEVLFYGRLFSQPKILDASPLILNARAKKSAWEIQQLNSISSLSKQAFEYISQHLKPGLSELELAGIVESFVRKHGHAERLRVRDWLTEGYTSHILSGSATGMVGLLDSPMSGMGASPAFPCGPSHRKIPRDEPIMIDINLTLNGYHFDETRMFVMGKMPEPALRLSEAAIEIHERVSESAKPGIRIQDLYGLAWEVAKRLQVEEEFLGVPGHKTRYIGHGIGIELVEMPILSASSQGILEEGMVFALEPKLVSTLGFGAGIESIFHVTANGARILSQTPVQIFNLD